MTNCAGKEAPPEETERPDEPMPEKKNNVGGILILVLFLAAGGGGALWYFKLRSRNPASRAATSWTSSILTRMTKPKNTGIMRTQTAPAIPINRRMKNECLIICEKPSVAKTVALALGAAEQKDGYLSGDGLLVSWCIGHLISMADAGSYDERYKKVAL